jgi:hypothetical protein
MSQLIQLCGREFRIKGRLIHTAMLESEKYRFLEEPADVIEALPSCGTRIDLFTFIQRLPDTMPKYDYPMEWDNLAAMPVSTFDHWWDHQIDKKTRNMARQAGKKGVVIREVPFSETLVQGIREVYNETPVRQGVPNTHFGKDFATVFREEATFLDSSIFIGAFLGEELIGFIKLLFDETRTQAGVLNIVSMIRHRDKAPTNALLAQAVRSCADRGIPYLVYSNFTVGKIERTTLSDFKERNGFRRVDVPRYYLPFTALGRLAFGLGLHRGLIDRLPGSLKSKLRVVRTAWYNRKVPSAAV